MSRPLHDPLVATLARFPLFAEVPRRHLRAVAGQSTPAHPRPGRTVCVEDEPGREAAIIISGTAVVCRRGQLLAQLGPGDLLGEIALLRNTARTASVFATSPLFALVFDPREFTGLLQLHGSIERRVMETIDGRLASNRVSDSVLGSSSPGARAASSQYARLPASAT